MTVDEEYRRDLGIVAGRIGDLDPPDLPERFASRCGLGRDSFRTVEPSREGTIAAVDGSNAIVLDAGCLSVAVLRAAACGFSGGRQPDGGATGQGPGATPRGRQPDGGATGRSAKDESPGRNRGGGATMVSPGATRKFRSVTPLRLATLGQEARHGSFAGLYRECFGTDPEATVSDDEPARTAGILRDTLEYWVARKTAERLESGDLLVIDGALRVTHASHDRVMLDLIRTCAAKRVHLCAVTKRSAVTWGGGLPLVPAARSLAESHAIAPPWFLRIPEDCLDVAPYRQWRHGVSCVAALHPGSPLAFRIEVPPPTGDGELGAVISRLAGWADDGRVTGYPYPLFDAHRTARIPADAVQLVKNDLLARMGDAGFDLRRFQELFGDLHDEFARY